MTISLNIDESFITLTLALLGVLELKIFMDLLVSSTPLSNLSTNLDLISSFLSYGNEFIMLSIFFKCKLMI